MAHQLLSLPCLFTFAESNLNHRLTRRPYITQKRETTVMNKTNRLITRNHLIIRGLNNPLNGSQISPIGGPGDGELKYRPSFSGDWKS